MGIKIAVNRCYGGFSLSEKATRAFAARKGIPKLAKWDRGFCDQFFTCSQEDVDRAVAAKNAGLPLSVEDVINKHYFDNHSMARNDPDLVAVIEELGKDANGEYADIEVVEIPDGVDWYIDEYDGCEKVAEKHRSW